MTYLLLRGVEDPVAVLASVGSLIAGLATVSTVLEMRAARVASARAILTVKPSELPLNIEWDMVQNTLSIIEPVPTLWMLNASTGAAQNVTIDWSVTTKLTQADLLAMSRVMKSPNTVKVSDEGYAFVLTSPDAQLSYPISGADEGYVGDVGPTQNYELSIPAVIMHYAAFKCLSLSSEMISLSRLSPEKMPSVTLRFKHSSIYEDGISDTHVVRFQITSFSAEDDRGRQLASTNASVRDVVETLRKIRISAQLELASRSQRHGKIVYAE